MYFLWVPYIRLAQIVLTKFSPKVFLSLMGQQLHIAPTPKCDNVALLNPNIYFFSNYFTHETSYELLSEITIVQTFFSTGFH